MRIAIGIEYDGSSFNGWQSNRGARTVQAELEKALSAVANEPIKLVCAGRTDSGVHACHQIAHFDTSAARSARSWVLGANSGLPTDASVLWAQPVSDQFHARFSALDRTYDYVIFNRQARPGLWAKKVTWECLPLDPEAMRSAACAWLGEHDFSSFRAKGCQAAHPMRTIHKFEVHAADGFIVLTVCANAFLQHMVRNLAGVLIEIGKGNRAPSWAAEVLAYRARERGGLTASPDGLYLSSIRYPLDYNLPTWHRSLPHLPAFCGASFAR